METKVCLFPVLWVKVCHVQKKKKRKETVVLMLLEKLPTQMTKLCPKPFSPQLAAEECWEIVSLLRHTSDVCGTKCKSKQQGS